MLTSLLLPSRARRPMRRVLAVLAACATGASALTVTLAVLPGTAAGSSAPILVARSEGGLVPAFHDLRRPPLATVMPDGRVHRPGATVAIFPGPMLQPVTVGRLSTSQLRSIDRLARSAGLHRRGLDLGRPPTADVPTLVVTYRGVTTRIASFGVGEERLPAAQRSARASVAKLLSMLDVASATVMSPTAVVMAVQAASSADAGTDLPPVVRDWPGSELSATECRVESATPVVRELAAATETTRYRSGGRVWLVFARPLVPGDAGCASR